MEIIRITYRMPISLVSKVRLLAEQNKISLNQQINELVSFGIKYFLEKSEEINIERDSVDKW